MINRAGHEGELEHSGMLRLQPLVEDKHVPPVPLRPKTKAAVRKIYQQWEESQGEGWRELSLQEKEKMENISPALPQPN